MGCGLKENRVTQSKTEKKAKRGTARRPSPFPCVLHTLGIFQRDPACTALELAPEGATVVVLVHDGVDLTPAHLRGDGAGGAVVGGPLRLRREHAPERALRL